MILERFKNREKLNEMYEVVAVYECYIEGMDRKLKVKVCKYGENNYLGVANLSVKGEGQAGHYRSLTNRKTKEEAAEDAITGFLVYYSDKADIKEVEDW